MLALKVGLFCLYVLICFIVAGVMARQYKQKWEKETIDVADMTFAFVLLVLGGWIILPLYLVICFWKAFVLLTVDDGVDHIIAWWENRNKQKNDAASRYQEIIAELEKELEEVRKENK